jgi:hypothetical protein
VLVDVVVVVVWVTKVEPSWVTVLNVVAGASVCVTGDVYV